VDSTGKKQSILSLFLTDYIASASDVRSINRELTPVQPVDLDSFSPTAGQYVQTLNYRDNRGLSILQQADDFQFDFRNTAVADSLWLRWKRTTRIRSGDSLIQIVKTDAEGNGSYSESRSDSLRESMRFSRATGDFHDTLWQVPPLGNALLRILHGSFDSSLQTAEWYQEKNQVTTHLFYSGEELRITGSDTVLGDTAILNITDTGAVWESNIDFYTFRYVYRLLADSRLTMSLRGWSNSPYLLKIQSGAPSCEPIPILQNGTGSGFISEANPEKEEVALDDENPDYTYYKINILLRKNTIFSGVSLF
jgi:hypothetical protein